MARKIKPAIVERSVRELLPEFTQAMESCYADYYVSQQVNDFREYMLANQEVVAEAILQASDHRARRLHSQALHNGYKRLRGRAYKEIMAIMPEIADTISRHV